MVNGVEQDTSPVTKHTPLYHLDMPFVQFDILAVSTTGLFKAKVNTAQKRNI